ncbi:hypothetical protein HYU06_07270 [Candidatus Woesearchaeota archaeon]|nr:hypothetical protein [Candidatus Woesearchaeota archaeon]
MPTDLKTLKDFPLIKHYNILKSYPCVSIDTLRSEAIKWIKELNQAKNNYCKGHYYFMLEESVDASDITSVIKFIRHFFNITDEDLK